MNNSVEKQIYNDIKKAICLRKIEAGSQLVESRISEKFESSRTPVRIAIKRLADDGFVNIIKNKGAFVVQPSLQEVTEAYELRREMEISGVRLCAKNFDDILASEINKLIETEYLALQKKELWKFLTINKKIHMKLARRSGNRYLVEYLNKLVDQINVYNVLYDNFYHEETENFESIKEHKALVEKILDKDEDGIIELLKVHIDVN